jgi:hypothetical protein
MNLSQRDVGKIRSVRFIMSLSTASIDGLHWPGHSVRAVTLRDMIKGTPVPSNGRLPVFRLAIRYRPVSLYTAQSGLLTLFITKQHVDK